MQDNINRILFMYTDDYFCHIWTVNNVFQYFELSKEVCFQSPEFKTGFNNESVKVFIKLICNSQ